jgi:hypothetical protein
MDVSLYLENKGYGYEHLSEYERKTIANFSLIWSLFESQLLEEDASAKKICLKSEKWLGVEEATIDGHLDYFKARYIERGEPNHRFDSLHLRRNDNPQLVLSVLKGDILDLSSKLSCCLIIVLRFRNNFFHGIKWAYHFVDQKDNFEHSCKILTHLLDRYA